MIATTHEPETMTVRLPPDMTLGELREAFPADRFVLVAKPDRSIEIRRRQANGALINVARARIVRDA